METVLITGGTGMIGSQLSNKLKEKGYAVAIFSRSRQKKGEFETYYWDPKNKAIDTAALYKADYIIHLAGENLTNKRWTKKQKKLIVDSRVKSSEFLFEKVRDSVKKPKTFISASAIGYYGAVTSDEIFTEADGPGNDFVAETCILWEKAADRFQELGIRTAKIRTSPVLSGEGGILSQLVIPVKFGFAAAIGSGKQYLPWIHIDDLCDIYIKAIEDIKMNGVYNASAPGHSTNMEFMRTLANVLHKPFWLPPVPGFLIKLIFGEKGEVALKGSRISSGKIQDLGFSFKFPELKKALENIFPLRKN